MVFLLLGDQTKIVHTRRAHVVHNVDHCLVSGARIGAKKNSLVRTIRDAIFDPIGELAGVLHQIAPEKRHRPDV